MVTRLGLIGCGGISQRAHLPGIEPLGDVVTVAAIADVMEENLAAVGGQIDVPASERYADYRDMLEKAELHAVLIATPHNLHCEQAIACAEAGLTIVAEKPMALSLEEADRIVEAVERAGIQYTVSHNYMFAAGSRRALELLDEAGFGQRVYGRTKSLFCKSREQSDPETVWRSRASAGGGCVGDTAYHEIYMLERAMGSPIRYVEGRLRSDFLKLDVDDLAVLLFEHENGAVSTLSTSWGTTAVGPNETANLCEVHSDENAIRIDRRGREVYTRERDQANWEVVSIPEYDGMSSDDIGRDGHTGYFREVFQALAEGRALPTSIQDARHNLAIIEGAKQASEQRRAIDVGSL
jgi:UDP-N-acetyl-2-amino-2-deoxyglucuronate dehydrogenase